MLFVTVRNSLSKCIRVSILMIDPLISVAAHGDMTTLCNLFPFTFICLPGIGICNTP